MHLYFLTRGIKQQVELFLKFMESQMFNWKRKNLKNKKDEIMPVQGALRPVQLWEYVFPEESLPDVLAMLDIREDGTKDVLGKTKDAALRKMLGKGVEKVPSYKLPKTKRFIPMGGVAIYPIGIKKDVRQKWEEIGYEQEML